ncbi:exported hypothetical protein [Verrucomicrobia bacterium]|nr:exported hypothetical protein [Verrucomicrobiota bacterium]
MGKNRRLVMAVMCVPMPPLFLDLPLRQMMLPFIGPLPVNSHFLAIQFDSFLSQKSAQLSACPPPGERRLRLKLETIVGRKPAVKGTFISSSGFEVR